jgi:hypothetical protein
VPKYFSAPLALPFNNQPSLVGGGVPPPPPENPKKELPCIYLPVMIVTEPPVASIVSPSIGKLDIEPKLRGLSATRVIGLEVIEPKLITPLTVTTPLTKSIEMFETPYSLIIVTD